MFFLGGDAVMWGCGVVSKLIFFGVGVLLTCSSVGCRVSLFFFEIPPLRQQLWRSLSVGNPICA